MKMLVVFQDNSRQQAFRHCQMQSLVSTTAHHLFSFVFSFVFSFDFPIHVFLYKIFLISCQLSRVLNQFKQALSILFLHLVLNVSFDRFKCTGKHDRIDAEHWEKIERFDSENEKKTLIRANSHLKYYIWTFGLWSGMQF